MRDLCVSIIRMFHLRSIYQILMKSCTKGGRLKCKSSRKFDFLIRPIKPLSYMKLKCDFIDLLKSAHLFLRITLD